MKKFEFFIETNLLDTLIKGNWILKERGNWIFKNTKKWGLTEKFLIFNCHFQRKLINYKVIVYRSARQNLCEKTRVFLKHTLTLPLIEGDSLYGQKISFTNLSIKKFHFY